MLLLKSLALSIHKHNTSLKSKISSYKEDLEFINKAKKNPNHFAMLYNKYWDQLFRFIYKKIQNLDDTGDVCQSTMLKAMTNIVNYEDRGFPFSAWLYRIAVNETNLYFRAKKKHAVITIRETYIKHLMTEINCQNKQNIDEQEKLLVILGQLKPKHLALIEFRYFFNYSFKDIALVYQISEASAKMRVYRALAKMQQKWKNYKK